MRRIAILALIFVLAVPEMVSAAAAAKGGFVIPPAPTPKDAGLRGAQDTTAATPATPTTALPKAGGQSRLAQSGLPLPNAALSSPGLAALGLTHAGDQTPVCRAQCSEDRYVCGADEGCDTRWRDCIESCSASTTR